MAEQSGKLPFSFSTFLSAVLFFFHCEPLVLLINKEFNSNVAAVWLQKLKHNHAAAQVSTFVECLHMNYRAENLVQM